MDKKNNLPKEVITYMVPYYHGEKMFFLKFHTHDYYEALDLAKCAFGENASKYLYQKKLIIKD